MARETYRWREEPDIIARFVHDKELPKNTPIVLRPNEVCVVLENGRISGIVTQQVMRANPTTSMLRRIFGGKRQRSYLFAFLGPYTFTMPFTSKSSDHQTMKGEASLRVHASRENIARLIQLPAKGIMEIRTSDISNLLIDEAQAYMSKTIQRFTNDELVQDQADENTTIGLCMALRRTIESFGMTIDHSYITWNHRIRFDLKQNVNMSQTWLNTPLFKQTETNLLSMLNLLIINDMQNTMLDLKPSIVQRWNGQKSNLNSLESKQRVL